MEAHPIPHGTTDLPVHTGRVSMTDTRLMLSWMRTGGFAGLLSAICYLLVAAAPLPSGLLRLLFFSWPILGIVAAIGIYTTLRVQRDGVLPQLGALFMIIGGVVATLMAVVQNSIFHYANRGAPGLAAPDLRQLELWVLRSVHGVQLGLDVAFDIFFLLGLTLLAAAMVRHPRFGRWIGGAGMLLAGATLVLNLYEFPVPPTPDLGPFVGLWAVAVSVQVLRSRRWAAEVLETRAAWKGHPRDVTTPSNRTTT